MLCQTFVWDISYRSIGGTIIIEEANLSNLNVSQSVSGPVIDAGGPKSVPVASLSSSLTISMVKSTMIGDFLSKFAAAYSQITLAYAAGAFDPTPATTAMTSSTKIVACVPVAPLWSLAALACIYLLLGVSFTTVALSALPGENVRSVQAQLSVAGLTAASFEQPPSSRPEQGVECEEELFEEYCQGHEGYRRRTGRWRRSALPRMREDTGSLARSEQLDESL